MVRSTNHLRIREWSIDVRSSQFTTSVSRTAVASLAAGRDQGRQQPADRRPRQPGHAQRVRTGIADRGRSEEHTSELQSLMRISYAVFCLKKKTTITK